MGDTKNGTQSTSQQQQQQQGLEGGDAARALAVVAAELIYVCVPHWVLLACPPPRRQRRDGERAIHGSPWYGFLAGMGQATSRLLVTFAPGSVSR